MPASVAVPSPLSRKVTPEGSVPVVVSAGVGYPPVVMVNVDAVPAVIVVVEALLIVGASSTVRPRVAVAVPDVLETVRWMAYWPPVPVKAVPSIDAKLPDVPGVDMVSPPGRLPV